MIVHPYKRTPEPPTVALLTAEGDIVDEHGDGWAPAELPATHRAWCSYDVVRQLVADGRGEALCWNGEEIRWRHGRLEDEWRSRHTDVSVLKLPFPDDDGRTLTALADWRDWLARHGASPTGTTGAAAMSLLRAKLDEPLFCTMGDAPPLLQTMGGRIETGAAGAGSFTGRLEQWDMPAAYAAEIGAMRYGGRWWKLADLPVQHDLEWWARDNRPTLAHARVRVGDGLGPLIRRPRKRTTMMRLYLESLTEPRYPRSTTLTGLWTWEEIAAAERHGARVLEVLDGYVHLGGAHVFGPWWQAVQEGRDMRGLAGMLAKMTGNALWGRFCMDVAVQGHRTIRGKTKGRRRLEQRPVKPRGKGPKPAHDLAETVSGHVRARLYDAMVFAGDKLLSAHTDGIWTRQLEGLEPSGWRRKMEARRLDLIDPQTLRYWPRRRGEAQYVMAGRTASESPAAFARLWKQGGYGDDDND